MTPITDKARRSSRPNESLPASASRWRCRLTRTAEGTPASGTSTALPVLPWRGSAAVFRPMPSSRPGATGPSTWRARPAGRWNWPSMRSRTPSSCWRWRPIPGGQPPFAPKPYDHRFDHPGWQEAAIPDVAAGVSGGAGLVGPCHRTDARPAPRRRRAHPLSGPPDARCRVAVELPRCSTPRSSPKQLRTGGRNLTEGAAHFSHDMLKTLSGQRDPAARRLPDRKGSGLHARPGRVSQRSVRADPVRAADRSGSGPADPDRAGLDHEVLHPRSVAAQFDGSLPCRAGLHRLHDLVVQPDRRAGATCRWRTTASAA